MASNTAMNGVINTAGQMQINFTQTNGDVTIALGNYRDVGGTNFIEMQMLSQVASAQNITHWAYMASYTNANYPTDTPTNPSLLATNWSWMQGTTWNIEDASLFGTNGSGTFSVSIYNSGYFWGDGTSATNGGFTLIGSATPEGNLILGLLNTQTGVQTSLFGDITGNASNSLMSLSTFTTNGITLGPPAASAALIPGSIANLYVTNGAALYLTNDINGYAYTYVGNAANDSNNALTVANASTVLTNSQNLYLGNGGSDNTMMITNGAMVAGRSGFIGYDASSSNNSVLVTGSNSVWSSSADLFVGYSGSSNSLIITNSAKVIASNTYISSFGGSNNSVQVSGAGSTLSNSGSIWVGASPIIGLAGAGTLTITSDGTVAASRLIISGSTDSIGTVEVGLKGGSDSNMTLDVPEIIFGEGTGSLGLNQSDTLTISGSITGAMATNSYAMIQQYGSGTTILTGISHTGLGYRVDGGQLMVNGGIFDIYLIDGLSPDELGGPRTVTVGNKNSGISLVVTNSGELHSFVTIIGTDLIKNSDTLTTSSNNWALVTGPGSKLIAGELQVGNVSSGNSLVISNGATVSSALASSIGISGSSNSVVVTGSGSLFTNAGSLTVGTYSQSYAAAANRLLVTNGSGLFSESAMIGATTNSFGNIVTVTGAGSFWTNSGALYVGNGGSGNSLTVANGATVAVGGGTNGTVVGFGAGSSNNSVLVTGSGSLWTNSAELYVGYEGSGNNLTIADGSTVAASGITIAASNTSSGTLNIGRFGTNDAAGTIIAPTIAFGAGTGSINFNQSNTMTLSAIISGNGVVKQLGSGTTELSGISTYTGSTSVEAGKLVVSGSIANSEIIISGTGALGGTGTLGALTILDGATLSPGNSPGNLGVAGNVTWNGGGNYNWQIYDTTLPAGAGWDLVTSSGALDLNSLTTVNKFNLNLWSLSGIAPDVDGDALNFDNTQNYTWTILTAATGINGFAADKFNINLGAANGTAGFANALGGGTFSLLTSGNNLNLMFTAAGGAAVPEPGTWAAAALLVGGAAFMRWRKRKQVS